MMDGIMRCCIYIVAHEESGGAVGPVKVGIGRCPISRLHSLQTGNPKKIILHKTYDIPSRGIARSLEHAFHSIQSAKRLSGEWFNLSPSEAEFCMRINLDCALFYKTDFSDEERESIVSSLCD